MIVEIKTALEHHTFTDCKAAIEYLAKLVEGRGYAFITGARIIDMGVEVKVTESEDKDAG